MEEAEPTNMAEDKEKEDVPGELESLPSEDTIVSCEQRFSSKLHYEILGRLSQTRIQKILLLSF